MQLRQPQNTTWMLRKFFRKFNLSFRVRRIQLVLPGLFIKKKALPDFKYLPGPKIFERIIFKPEKNANIAGLVARQQDLLREILAESRAILKEEAQQQLEKERERIQKKYQSKKKQQSYEPNL